MRLPFMSAVSFAFGLLLTGCASSPELGFDPGDGHVRLRDILVSHGDCLQNHL